MKCLVCPSEIDDKKQIPHAVDHNGNLVSGPGSPEERMRAEIAQRDHSRHLNAWRQVLVTLDEGNDRGGALLLQGHICSGHASLGPGDIDIRLKEKEGVK